MSIELSLVELKELLSGQPAAPANDLSDEYIGKFVLVRTYSAGVHAGYLERRNGLEVKLAETQRLWRWYEDVADDWDAGALTGVAIHGVKKGNSKISEILSSIVLTEAIEIMPLTDNALASIRSLQGWNC
jgi:hypothetical protein